MDDPSASINQIQRHESSVLETSELFRSGILKSDQLGTLNMCDMVSKTFWNLVKSSLRGELEKLQDHLFALETEWRNKFRNVRELDRFQLFEKVGFMFPNIDRNIYLGKGRNTGQTGEIEFD